MIPIVGSRPEEAGSVQRKCRRNSYEVTTDLCITYSYNLEGKKRGQATFLETFAAVRVDAGWIPGPTWSRSPKEVGVRRDY